MYIILQKPCTETWNVLCNILKHSLYRYIFCVMCTIVHCLLKLSFLAKVNLILKFYLSCINDIQNSANDGIKLFQSKLTFYFCMYFEIIYFVICFLRKYFLLIYLSIIAENSQKSEETILAFSLAFSIYFVYNYCFQTEEILF